MVAKFNSKTCHKKPFFFFYSRFERIWLLSVQNNAKTSTQKITLQNFEKDIKIAKFEADFECMLSRSYILPRTVN
jgi:hypothetical protein